MGELTHFNKQGRARMVDVTEKAVTHRRAVAAGEIHVSLETMAHIKNGTMKKGDVLAVAQVAGIQAAKRNWELIPMCHPLPLTGIDISFHLSDQPCMVEIRAAVTCIGVTGVDSATPEMCGQAIYPATVMQGEKEESAARLSGCKNIVEAVPAGNAVTLPQWGLTLDCGKAVPADVR